MRHVLLHDSPSVRLNRDRRISLKGSTALKYARVLITITWTEVHEIDVRRFAQFDPMHHVPPCRLQIKRGTFSHTEEEKRN